MIFSSFFSFYKLTLPNYTYYFFNRISIVSIIMGLPSHVIKLEGKSNTLPVAL